MCMNESVVWFRLVANGHGEEAVKSVRNCSRQTGTLETNELSLNSWCAERISFWAKESRRF